MKLDHQLVARTVVLGAWGAFFAWLWLSEQGVRFVGPRTYWVILFGAVLLLSATLGHLILLHRTTGTGQTLSAREIGAIVLTIAPMIVLLLVPRAQLGSLAASRKISYQGPAAAGSFAQLEKPSGEIGLREVSYANQYSNYGANWGISEGTEVELTGFVTHPDDISEGSFALTRFYINCCAADVVPYSVAVRTMGDSPDVADDIWMEISGVLERDSNGRLVLVPDSSATIAVPDQPYLY